MMKYLFLLSGENPKLAKEEVISLVSAMSQKLIGKLLIIDTEKSIHVNELSKRLALTKSIHSLLFVCNKKNLIKNMENFDWNSLYKQNFCIRVLNFTKNSSAKNPPAKAGGFFAGFSEKKLAGYIWNKVKNPGVNLEAPKTLINLFFVNGKIFCTKVQEILSHDFEKRKSHLRPRPSPTSLHPKIARALVNLTGIGDKKETVADLFCGSAGIPIEAGLMGFKTIANDINKKMIWKTITNLKYYKIKNYRLMNKDIFRINKKFDYVVSDLPYGLNSSIYFNKKNLPKANFFSEELERFYLKILKKLRKITKKRIVLIFPHYVNYKKLIKMSKLKLKNEFEVYVHKSLTRKIVVLEH